MAESFAKITLADDTQIRLRIWTDVSNTSHPPSDILLLHGWPNSSRIWTSLAKTLILATAPNVSLRIVAPDLRGFGESDKPESGYTCEQFAQDVLAIADAVGLQNYLLIGHSMSGKIAQIVAAKQPAKLSALVLLTPGLLSPSAPVDVSGRIASYGDLEKTRAMVVGWTAHPLSEADQIMLTEEGLQTGQDAWKGWLQVMRNEDFAAMAPEIAVPTLVIGGAKDPQRTEEELQTGVVAPIANATYVSIPTVGHLPQLEDPIALASLIINFQDSLPKAGGL